MTRIAESDPQHLEEVNLVDYLVVLARHSRMIAYSTLVVGIITAVVVLIWPKEYTAVARLIPPQQNITLSAQILEGLGASMIPGRAGGLGGFAESLLGLKSPGEFFVGLLRSDTISDRIIHRFQLRERFRASYVEQAREKLAKKTDIRTTKFGIITIEVTDRDPRRAAEMANAYTEELSRLLKEIAAQETTDRLALLEKERHEAEVRLAKAEEDLRAFSEKNRVLLPDVQTRSVLEYLANLRATIDYREVELQVLKQRATPNNHEVMRLEAELSGLREKLRRAEMQEGTPEGQGHAMIAAGMMPVLGLEYLRLYRETRYQEGLYKLYCKLVEIARLDQAREAVVVQVVDRASPPERKSKPKRVLTVLVVSGFTFLTLTMYILLRERLRTKAVTPEHMERVRSLKAALEPWRQDIRRLLRRG